MDNRISSSELCEGVGIAVIADSLQSINNTISVSVNGNTLLNYTNNYCCYKLGTINYNRKTTAVLHEQKSFPYQPSKYEEDFT